MDNCNWCGMNPLECHCWHGGEGRSDVPTLGLYTDRREGCHWEEYNAT